MSEQSRGGDSISIERAHNMFASAIGDRQSSRDEAIRTTMGGIYALAGRFALAMTEAGIPTKRVIEQVYAGEPGPENKYAPELVARRSLPLWGVVRNTDLSARPLIEASIDKEVSHYSILSHSYSGSHHEYRDIKPSEVEGLKLGYNETLRYYETAIAVSALGRLVLLQKAYYKGNNWRTREQKPDYSFHVCSKAVQPSDLFNADKSINPKKLVGTMEQRLSESMERYRNKLNDERKKGPVFRDQDYYEIQDLPLPQRKAKEQPFERRRWGFGHRK